MSSPPIRFRKLSIDDGAVRHAYAAALDRVMNHGQVLLGKEVESFERMVADTCGRKFCVALSSGTNALYIALRLLGVGPGAEVVTTPLSAAASASAIAFLGATPVYVDLADDLNIEPSKIARAITPNTKAIMPVHYAGRVCDMDTIKQIAARANIPIIEDASQAYGASLNGTPAGSFGTISTFSMNPMKTLPSLGEAGAIVFDEPDLLMPAQKLRYVGLDKAMISSVAELNHKPDALQCAFMTATAGFLPQWLKHRQDVAAMYDQLLPSNVIRPVLEETRSVFFDYHVLVERRDELFSYLAGNGVEVKIRYKELLCDHPALRGRCADPLINARRITNAILSLPIDEKIPGSDIQRICAFIREFYKTR